MVRAVICRPLTNGGQFDLQSCYFVRVVQRYQCQWPKKKTIPVPPRCSTTTYPSTPRSMSAETPMSQRGQYEALPLFISRTKSGRLRDMVAGARGIEAEAAIMRVKRPEEPAEDDVNGRETRGKEKRKPQTIDAIANAPANAPVNTRLNGLKENSGSRFGRACQSNPHEMPGHVNSREPDSLRSDS